MSENTQFWMLFWLFCIAVNSCTNEPKVIVDICDKKINSTIKADTI